MAGFCPLCGAKRPSGVTSCRVCQTPFDHESPPLTHKREKKPWPTKRIFATLVIALLLIIPYMTVGDLLHIPSDVAHSRKAFRTLRTNNEPLTNPVLAQLFDAWRLGAKQNSHVAISPKGPNHILISKREAHTFPVHVILSLELELEEINGQLHSKIISLRRGSRELPKEMGWVYFGSELQYLKAK